MEGGIGQDAGPGGGVQPLNRAMRRGPMVDERKQQTQLRREGKWPVEIRRDSPTFAGYRGDGRQEVATEGADLKPSGARVVSSSDHQDQSPC